MRRPPPAPRGTGHLFRATQAKPWRALGLPLGQAARLAVSSRSSDGIPHRPSLASLPGVLTAWELSARCPPGRSRFAKARGRRARRPVAEGRQRRCPALVATRRDAAAWAVRLVAARRKGVYPSLLAAPRGPIPGRWRRARDSQAIRTQHRGWPPSRPVLFLRWLLNNCLDEIGPFRAALGPIGAA